MGGTVSHWLDLRPPPDNLDSADYNHKDFKAGDGTRTNLTDRSADAAVQARGGGPLGLGNPGDRQLTQLEMEILIPQRMKDICRTQLCRPIVNKYDECCYKEGVSMIWNCSDLLNEMNDCYETWFKDKEFIKGVAEEYLQERSHHRQTGLRQTRYMRGSFIRRDVDNDPPVDSTGRFKPQKPVGWDDAYPDGPPEWSSCDYS